MRQQPVAAQTTPAARDVFSLSWPMTVKAILLHGTVVIDGWLVSSLGEVSLAAMGLAATIAGLVSGIIFAFSNALQIRTAQAFGTKDPIFMKSVLASGLALGIGIGIVGVAALWLFGQAILMAIAPDASVAAEAWSYLSIFTIAILAESIGQNLSSHFNGCGRTKLPLYSYVLSVPINITLSVILIHGYFGFPTMGVAGAALGSAIAIAVQAVFLATMAWRMDGNLRHVKGWRNGAFSPTIRRHVVFGWPIAVTFISANFQPE